MQALLRFVFDPASAADMENQLRDAGQKGAAITFHSAREDARALLARIKGKGVSA